MQTTKIAAHERAADEKICQLEDSTENKIEQAAEALAIAYANLKEMGPINVAFNPRNALDPVMAYVSPETMKKIPGIPYIWYSIGDNYQYLNKSKNVGMIVFQSAEPVGGGVDES